MHRPWGKWNARATWPRVWVGNPSENGTLAHLGPYGTRTVPTRNTKWVQSVSGWIRLAGHVVTWRTCYCTCVHGGSVWAKCDQYMTFLDGLRLSIRDSRDQRSVGWRTGARGRVTTWRTWSPGVLRCGDTLPLSENSIFYTFCIFIWSQITNGGTGIYVDHISYGYDHVNGSSTRAHKVAPPATWQVPEGVKHFRWP